MKALGKAASFGITRKTTSGRQLARLCRQGHDKRWVECEAPVGPETILVQRGCSLLTNDLRVIGKDLARLTNPLPTTQKALNSIPIPIPKSVETQAEIVESLELLQEETQRLARLSERKLAALEALKRSLLHQAFSGQL